MAEEATLEQVPLTKRGLLEYLAAQQGPVTAKVVSIDLDSRASTVTEMLERCVAQGLAERTTDQRPREYKLSEEGRRRLDSLRSKGGEPPSESDAPGKPESQGISDYLTLWIDERVETALEKRSKQAPSDGSHSAPGRVKALKDRAERVLSDDSQETTDPQETESITAESHPCVRELLAIERGLSELPRQELRKLRDSLREQIGDEEVCKKASRLAAAEAELCAEKKRMFGPDADRAARLEKEIGELQSDLGVAEATQEDSEQAGRDARPKDEWW